MSTSHVSVAVAPPRGRTPRRLRPERAGWREGWRADQAPCPWWQGKVGHGRMTCAHCPTWPSANSSLQDVQHWTSSPATGVDVPVCNHLSNVCCPGRLKASQLNKDPEASCMAEAEPLWLRKVPGDNQDSHPNRTNQGHSLAQQHWEGAGRSRETPGSGTHQIR